MRVAVLGGGIQGACIAMELASAGIAVDLYEKGTSCLSHTSARNEGKIHLGYVYANDRSLRTARLMVQGAVAFAPLMRRWVGDAIDEVPVSKPFHYVVHTDSLLTVDEVEHHLRSSHAIAIEESRGLSPDYFGADYRVAPSRLPEGECNSLFDRRRVVAAYRTAEMGIASEALATVVRSRLSATPRIQCLLRAHVYGVVPAHDSVTVEAEMDGSRTRERYDHVVNALWDGRLAVDKTVGLRPERSWLYRVKHYVRLQAPDMASNLPCTTIVLGAFGDVVTYADGSLYLSWYPAGMTGISSDLTPPDWPLVLDAAASDDMRDKIFDGLRDIVPGVGFFAPETMEHCRVEAGIIFAWGTTDIDDPASGLHERHAIGFRSCGRYHTVDTGKLTMAPLFGKMVADRIRQVS